MRETISYAYGKAKFVQPRVAKQWRAAAWRQAPFSDAA